MRRWLLPIAVGALAAAAAWHATLVATPYALMRVAMKRLGEQGRTNAFLHAPPTRAERQPVVRPSPDLLYSICVFDLSLHVLRAPRGEWIGLRGRSGIEADGIGQSAATLFDGEGAVGRALVSLLVERR